MFVSVVHGADQYEKQESNLQRCTAIEDPVQQFNAFEDELIHKQLMIQKRKETQTLQEESQVPQYSIKLSQELQEYLYEKCTENELEYELVLAVMRLESNFKSNLISSTNDYGLMQINTCNHQSLKKKLGITDFLNAKQSIDAGVYMLSDLSDKYKDEHKLLTAYNWGEYGMLRGWKKGVRSSKYSRKVLQYKEQLIEDGGF